MKAINSELQINILKYNEIHIKNRRSPESELRRFCVNAL